MAGTKRLVAVFGGSGFLGRSLVRQLIPAGYDVRLVARHPERSAAVLTALGPGLAEAVCADIRDPDAVARAVEQSFAVVNAVGLYRESGSETFAAIHEQGASNVAAAAAKAGVERLIQISGIGVDLHSSSSYVRSRAVGERRAREAFAAVTILRPSALFGPDAGLLASLDALTRALPVFPLFGPGTLRLQPVHVEDVAQAVVNALGDPASAGRVYELGGPEALSYRAIVELVLRAHNRRRLLLPVPFAVWHLLARLLTPFPNPPVTVHQLALLERDNLVAPAALSLSDLRITPTSMEDCLPGR